MRRRDFIRSTGAMCLSAAGCAHHQEDRAARPNIMFLFTDDWTYEAVHALGCKEIETPNIDRLARRGVSFTHTYVMGGWHGAICVASRTTLNTGRGLWESQSIEPALADESSARRLWSQLLEDAGYDTYFSGKWHVLVDVETAFQTVRHVRGGMPPDTKECYGRPIEGRPDPWRAWDSTLGGFWEGGRHWSELMVDDTVDYLEAARHSAKPFFMYLSFNAPHDPRQSPREYLDKYPPDRIPLPENYLPEYPYLKDIMFGNDMRDENLAPFPRTEYAVKVHRSEYYAAITHLDEQIGRILDALERSGKADNTYVLFAGDNGLACGHHGLMGKQSMFEHSVRVPLIMTGPGFPKGKRIDALTYLPDLMPTTLELAGAPVPAHVSFRSLLPLIDGSASRNWDTIYCAYMNLQRMITDGRYKLIVYPKIGKKLLFDLEEDPSEMHDLASQTEHAERISEMLQALERQGRKFKDPIVAG